MKIEGNLMSYKKEVMRVFDELESVLNEDFSNAYLSINFVSDEEIRELNKKFRKIDKKTDVLSFPNLNISVGEKINNFISEADFDSKLLFLGDIVICKDVAREQAKENQHTLKFEVSFLSLHGLLHLLGYDHMTDADEKVMFGIQDQVLDRCGL